MLKGSWNHWAFSVYYNPSFQNLVLFCILVHLSIIFFEPGNSRTDERAYFERIGFLLLELLLTCVHLFDTWLKILHMGKKEFLSKGWNSYTLYYRLAIGIDALFCLITGVRFRFSRILRPALLVTRNRELRQLYDTVSQTVFELVEIATLILSLIVLYTVIAVQLFGAGCPEEWGNYWSSALSLFVLLTGDNYPDIFRKPYSVRAAPSVCVCATRTRTRVARFISWRYVSCVSYRVLAPLPLTPHTAVACERVVLCVVPFPRRADAPAPGVGHRRGELQGPAEGHRL